MHLTNDELPDLIAPDPAAVLRASQPDGLEGLLFQMRNGDREAAARFILTYGARIQRRIRGKLGPSMRRLFDSQEILSTIGRRLDLYVRDRKLDASEERDLWMLVFRMADNAVVDKGRIYQKLQSVEGRDSPFAHSLLARLRRAEAKHSEGVEIELEFLIKSLPVEMDRVLLKGWLHDRPLDEIADRLNMTPAAVRKRWERVKTLLRSELLCDPDA